VPCTSRRPARISPAPAPRQISPAARIRRCGVGWASAKARYPAIPPGCRGLGPLPGQRHVGRIQLRHHLAADEPQVRPQRPPRHAGQARRSPGEPLGRRGVQHYLWHRLQAERNRVIGELARGPQQVLRPLLPLRCHLPDHVPGERRRLQRQRRWPPLGDIRGHLGVCRLHEASQAGTFHSKILWKDVRPADLRRCVAWNPARLSARPVTG